MHLLHKTCVIHKKMDFVNTTKRGSHVNADSDHTLTRVSSSMVQSSEGWSVCSHVDAPEERQCEYRGEFGGRIPFRIWSVVGSDHITSRRLYGCDWNVMMPDGSSREVSFDFRLEIVSRIVAGLNVLLFQDTNVFHTEELLKVPSPPNLQKDASNLCIQKSGENSVTMKFLGRELTLPILFDAVRHELPCVVLKMSDVTTLDELSVQHQAFLMDSLKSYVQTSCGQVLVIEKY